MEKSPGEVSITPRKLSGLTSVIAAGVPPTLSKV
jgi:hypothetical protein